jgi:hypothetical protein
MQRRGLTGCGLGARLTTLPSKTKYIWVIQRSEYRIKSGAIFQGMLCLKKHCFANDEFDDADDDGVVTFWSSMKYS